MLFSTTLTKHFFEKVYSVLYISKFFGKNVPDWPASLQTPFHEKLNLQTLVCVSTSQCVEKESKWCSLHCYQNTFLKKYTAFHRFRSFSKKISQAGRPVAGQWPLFSGRLAGQPLFQKHDFLKKQCSKKFSTRDIDLIVFVTCFLDLGAHLTIQVCYQSLFW